METNRTKVLLIDDDPDVRTVISNVLEKQGYEVATASGREEALQLLVTEKPGVVLLDVLLSGTDGRDLCREIKAAETTCHIRVIILSGHPGAAQKFESYGANDFLAKPFTTETLLGKLSQQVAMQK